MLLKTCKLEYYIRNMSSEDTTEIIYLIDKNHERDFSHFNIRAITEFKELNPVPSDELKAFDYKNTLYLYTRISLRFESIFRRINELFIKNNVQPIFIDPSNLAECLKIRKDVLVTMSYHRANEFFGVNDYREYTPPVYKE